MKDPMNLEAVKLDKKKSNGNRKNTNSKSSVELDLYGINNSNN